MTTEYWLPAAPRANTPRLSAGRLGFRGELDAPRAAGRTFCRPRRARRDRERDHEQRWPAMLIRVGAFSPDGGAVVSTNYVEVKLRASQLKFGDRLISDDGTPGQFVTQVTTRGRRITVSHPAGHTRLIGDPPLRVLRRAPGIETDHDKRDLSHPSGDEPARPAKTSQQRAPEQTREQRTLSGDSRQRPLPPAAAPVFLAPERTPQR